MASTSLGERIIESIKITIRQSEEASKRLHYPGEGGERSFRSWLAKNLLETLLGWPADKIMIGERFDILLLDSDSFPVMTIETKAPGHKASRKERKDFEERLSGYGTLRSAYFTNGFEWNRLDIHSPTGVLEIRDRSDLYLDKTTAEEAEAFFLPLIPDRYFQEVPRSTRFVVNSQNTHILQALASDLDQCIKDLTSLFEREFAGLRYGKAGDQARTVVLNLFDLWCDKSLIISPSKAGERVFELFKKQDLSRYEIDKVVIEFGWNGTEANSVSDTLKSLSKTEKEDITAIITTIWPAYNTAIKNLCAQTAHVVMARALLYRVGEDQNIFQRVLSDKPLEQALATHTSSLLTNGAS